MLETLQVQPEQRSNTTSHTNMMKELCFLMSNCLKYTHNKFKLVLIDHHRWDDISHLTFTLLLDAVHLHLAHNHRQPSIDKDTQPLSQIDCSGLFMGSAGRLTPTTQALRPRRCVGNSMMAGRTHTLVDHPSCSGRLQ